MACDNCRSNTTCTNPAEDVSGKALCYGCWHAWRESQPPFRVQSSVSPSLYSGGDRPVVYLESEAIKQGAVLDKRSPWLAPWRAVPAESWAGDRLSHPGYMEMRRAAIAAEQPPAGPSAAPLTRAAQEETK